MSMFNCLYAKNQRIHLFTFFDHLLEFKKGDILCKYFAHCFLFCSEGKMVQTSLKESKRWAR